MDDEKKSDRKNDIIEMRYKHFDVKCETFFTNINNAEGNLDNISSKITFIDGITNIAYQHKFTLNEGIDSVKKFPELIKSGLNPNNKDFEFQYRIENNILKASITKILNNQDIDNPVYKFELIRVKKPSVNMEILMNKFKEMENELKSLKIELKKVKRDNAKLKKCVTGDISYMDTWKGHGTKNKKTRNDDFGCIKWMKFGKLVVLQGLAISKDTIDNTNNVIAIIPAEIRPKIRLIFNVNNGDGYARVDVCPNGQISYVKGNKNLSANYISCSGIAYYVE